MQLSPLIGSTFKARTLSVFFLAAECASAQDIQRRLEGDDRACLSLLGEGREDTLRLRCSRLEPAEHPIATYWRLFLATDMNDLRRGLAPEAMSRLNPPGPRLLELAALYHHSRGQWDQLDAVLALASRHHQGTTVTQRIQDLARVAREVPKPDRR